MKINKIWFLQLICYSLLITLQISCTSSDPVKNSVKTDTAAVAPAVPTVPVVVPPDPSIFFTSQNIIEIGPLTPLALESSGLVYDGGYVWTHNDSGNSSAIYKVDPSNGKIIQTIMVTNFPNNDWEDITADDNYLYIEDAGNNDGIRTNLKVLRIDKNQYKNNTDTTVSVVAEAINFSYSDQTSFVSSKTHNFDCESLISIGTNLYLFSKDRGDSQTRVYKLSKTPGTYVISPYTSYDVKGLVTGADYNPITKQVVLIGYQSSHTNSFLYYLSNFTDDMFFSGTINKVAIGNSTNDWQTEGVAFHTNNEIFISCESSSFKTATLLSMNIKQQ